MQITRESQSTTNQEFTNGVLHVATLSATVSRMPKHAGDCTRRDSPGFTNDTLRKAVNLWCKDRDTAMTLYGNITHWDTSNVTNMKNLFYYKHDFNDLLEWDTSNVTDMSGMFSNTSNFNQPLHFNTSKVTDMYGMFEHASSFNQSLRLDTSNVTDMSSMFYGASSFNQLLCLDTSNVTDMSWMFYCATSFNQPLRLNTSNVTTMWYMFYAAKSFNQYLEFNILPNTNCKQMFTNTPIHTLYGVDDIKDPKYALLKYRENHKYVVWLSANDSPDKDNILYALPTDITRYLCGYLYASVSA